MNLSDLALDLAAVVNVVFGNMETAFACAAETAKKIDEKLAHLAECLEESDCDTDDC